MNKDNLKQLKSLKQDYLKTFGTEEGKRVLEDLRRACFVNTTTINEIPHVIAFNEGHRAVYLHIQTRMRMDTITLEESDGTGQLES